MHGRKWGPTFLLLALTLALSLSAACGGGGGGGAKATATSRPPLSQSPASGQPTATPKAKPTEGAASVDMRNTAFHPQTITISKGATVTWTNSDSVPHTVTGDDVDIESGNMNKGDTFAFTFTQQGEFNYHCSIHPAMKGRVVIQ